jgi:hypothetical protein
MTRRKILTRSILAAAGVALLASASAVIGSGSSQADVLAAGNSAARAAALAGRPPAILDVPAGNALTAAFSARGVQVYRCTAGAWVFVEPAANLSGWSTQPTRGQDAVHFRGPSWESTVDGSLVEAKVSASSPVPGSIAQLLLQASVNRGDGVFGKVSYIQRLNTSGGAFPAGACTEGATTGVPYKATYLFYSPV